MRVLTLAAIVHLAATPAVAGDCRTVHGRMSLTNGTPSVRIWVVGTHRILGVVQQDQTFDDLPANIRRLWGAHGDEAMWSSDLFGDFRVCPLTKNRPGWMQFVRVTGATHLRVHPRT